MDFHPIANCFPLLEGDEFAELVEDIGRHGLREPIWFYENMILDGRNRYRACQEAGVEVVGNVYPGDDPVGFVISLNLKRRHMDTSQRSIVAARLATCEWGGNRQGANLRLARAETADMLNVSERTVDDAAAVLHSGDAELVAAVERGEKAVSKAAKEIRKKKAAGQAKRHAELARSIIVPQGKYGCIVIDPPWDMKKIDRDVRPNQVGFDYPTMSEEDLAALGVPDMAADDCHLFLWTTSRFLPMALRLTERWGFTYGGLLGWKKPGGFQPIGLWQYNLEPIIYARKGHPKFTDTTQFFAAFDAPRREHSRKPDEFYDTIRRVTAAPRIDVFSREKRDGFAQYGNETEKFSV